MSLPHSLVCLISSKMIIFHAKGKVELIILVNNLGILHVTMKCLCVMFGFHMGFVHVSKDKMYDDNNNAIRSIYQIPILGDFGLEWKKNAKRFRIVAKDIIKSFQNIVFTSKTTTFVTNATLYLVDIKQKVVPKCVDLNFVHRFVQFVR
jgi:hypothetical protein